uniref:Uncharacterized protein n=2 Tax=Oryza meridionalis TaxID=40149 RepID=A0A0E0D323_9ORYZ
MFYSHVCKMFRSNFLEISTDNLKRRNGGSIKPGRYGGEWCGGGGGCWSGLGFYLLLLCLVLCAMFANEGIRLWIPGTLLAASLLGCSASTSSQVVSTQTDR